MGATRPCQHAEFPCIPGWVHIWAKRVWGGGCRGLHGFLARPSLHTLTSAALMDDASCRSLIYSELTLCRHNTNHQAALQAFAIFTFTLCSTCFVITLQRRLSIDTLTFSWYLFLYTHNRTRRQ